MQLFQRSYMQTHKFTCAYRDHGQKLCADRKEKEATCNPLANAQKLRALGPFKAVTKTACTSYTEKSKVQHLCKQAKVRCGFCVYLRPSANRIRAR